MLKDDVDNEEYVNIYCSRLCMHTHIHGPSFWFSAHMKPLNARPEPLPSLWCLSSLQINCTIFKGITKCRSPESNLVKLHNEILISINIVKSNILFLNIYNSDTNPSA